MPWRHLGTTPHYSVVKAAALFPDAVPEGRSYPPTDMKLANPNTVLWAYIVMLVAGGLIGYYKAGSKASLIASVSFGAILTLCAIGVIFQPHVADIILAILLVFFGFRLTKSKKFVPNGLMLLLTLGALALRHLRL